MLAITSYIALFNIMIYNENIEKEEVLKMVKVLSEKATVKVGAKWLVLKAILITKPRGKAVVYVDAEGNEIHQEPLCKSQFKGTKID